MKFAIACLAVCLAVSPGAATLQAMAAQNKNSAFVQGQTAVQSVKTSHEDWTFLNGEEKPAALLQSSKAGLQFPVGRIHRLLRKGNYATRLLMNGDYATRNAASSRWFESDGQPAVALLAERTEHQIPVGLQAKKAGLQFPVGRFGQTAKITSEGWPEVIEAKTSALQEKKAGLQFPVGRF